jgi:hypothetical protein
MTPRQRNVPPQNTLLADGLTPTQRRAALRSAVHKALHQLDRHDRQLGRIRNGAGVLSAASLLLLLHGPGILPGLATVGSLALVAVTVQERRAMMAHRLWLRSIVRIV